MGLVGQDIWQCNLNLVVPAWAVSVRFSPSWLFHSLQALWAQTSLILCLHTAFPSTFKIRESGFVVTQIIHLEQSV